MKKGSQRTVEERRELTIMFEFLGMDANGVFLFQGWGYTIAHFKFFVLWAFDGRGTATPSFFFFFQRSSLRLLSLKRFLYTTKEHGCC